MQSKKQINLAAGVGVAVHEYHTNIGPAGLYSFCCCQLRYFDNDTADEEVSYTSRIRRDQTN